MFLITIFAMEPKSATAALPTNTAAQVAAPVEGYDNVVFADDSGKPHQPHRNFENSKL